MVDKYYMNLFDIILLAVALAMDCFAVSIVSGVMNSSSKDTSLWTMKEVRMALLFGLFQAMMPLIGWLGTNHFSEQLEAYDHWIAFSLLALIGGNMIREAFEPEEERHFNPTKLRTQLILAIATSIDALAVGVSFACTGYHQLSQIVTPIIIIGIVSFLFSIVGHQLGCQFGKTIANRLKPGLFGGIILIFIGIKILISHLMA